MTSTDIYLREGQVVEKDIMLYTVWISPGNPAPTQVLTNIYLYDPTVLQEGGGSGLATGSILFNVESGEPYIYIGDPLILKV